jgi:hypothetical protein
MLMLILHANPSPYMLHQQRRAHVLLSLIVQQCMLSQLWRHPAPQSPWFCPICYIRLSDERILDRCMFLKTCLWSSCCMATAYVMFVILMLHGYCIRHVSAPHAAWLLHTSCLCSSCCMATAYVMFVLLIKGHPMSLHEVTDSQVPYQPLLVAIILWLQWLTSYKPS